MLKIKTLVKTTVAAGTIALSASAFAYGAGTGYAGIELGYAGISIDSGTPANAGGIVLTKKDSGGAAGRIHLGLNFNEYFALEVGASQHRLASWDTNNVNVPKVKARITTLDLLARANVPLTYGVEGFALAGLAYVHQNNSRDVAYPDQVTWHMTNATKAVVAKYGLGASYEVMDKVKVQVSYQRTQGHGDRSTSVLTQNGYTPPINFFGIGVSINT